MGGALRVSRAYDRFPSKSTFWSVKILLMSKIFGHFDSLISMIWGHHWIENSRKWGGFCGSQGPAIGSQASFKILSGTAGIPHFFSSSAVLLQWRSKFWKLAWEPIAAYFWSKCRTQLEISVSKMGFMLPDLKNHSKSVKRFRLKNGKSWCLANEHFFFFVLVATVLYLIYATVFV